MRKVVISLFPQTQGSQAKRRDGGAPASETAAIQTLPQCTPRLPPQRGLLPLPALEFVPALSSCQCQESSGSASGRPQAPGQLAQAATAVRAAGAQAHSASPSLGQSDSVGGGTSWVLSGHPRNTWAASPCALDIPQGVPRAWRWLLQSETRSRSHLSSLNAALQSANLAD